MTPEKARHDRRADSDPLFLVLNCGSSSIKFALFDAGRGLPSSRPVWSGKVQGIGGAHPVFEETGVAPQGLELRAADPYHHALAIIRQRVTVRLGTRRIVGVGHRVVHGGSRYFAPIRVTPPCLSDLQSYIPLAPLHQPFALDAIETLLAVDPGMPQVACFDTAFHHTLAPEEQVLPLPYRYFQQGVRRYGFHGLSYDYLSHVLPDRHGDLASGRVIIAHLGSGASLCALSQGKSVATSMGFSALDGLMMGTRTGSLDPGVVLYLLETEKMSPADLGRLLYHDSGLAGVSGLSAEPRVLLAAEQRTDQQGEQARLAMALYVRRIVREIGALAAVLGGLDLLVFTAGVGEHSAPVRARVVNALEFLGMTLDAAANQTNAPVISTAAGRVRVAVEPTNEEWIIALHMHELLAVTS
jgi:acetate kinase